MFVCSQFLQQRPKSSYSQCPWNSTVASRTLQLVRRPVDILLRPSTVVQAPAAYEATSVTKRAYIALKLTVFFVANLLLYTFPLSLAGIGTIDPALTAPAWFAGLAESVVSDPDAVYRFLLRLAENSLFLFVAAVLTFAAVHVGVLITRESNGILMSLRVVTYSTALYLATLFTLVWYTASSPNIVVADDLLLFVQAEGINFIIDQMGSNLVLPGEYPSDVNTAAMTLHGKALIVAIMITMVYYVYVLYLGARVAHGTSRLTSLFVVGFVSISPVLYVVGSVLAVELAITIPQGILV